MGIRSPSAVIHSSLLQMADTSKGRHTLGRAVQDISHFLGYVLCLHGLGMLGSFIVRGTPWDPWTAPWHAFLRLAGEDKFLLYAFGTTVVTTVVTTSPFTSHLN